MAPGVQEFCNTYVNLTDTMDFLSKHLRRDKGYTVRADMETLAVFFRVNADFQSLRDFTILVDDDTLQCHIASDIHIG